MFSEVVVPERFHSLTVDDLGTFVVDAGRKSFPSKRNVNVDDLPYWAARSTSGMKMFEAFGFRWFARAM